MFKELDSILGHRPASVSTSVLDTGTTSSIVEESTEETQKKTGKRCTVVSILHSLSLSPDVQAESPIESAIVPESETESSKEQPGDQAGMLLLQ